MRAHSLAGRLVLLQLALALVVVGAFAGSALWWTARGLHAQQQAFLAETAARVARAFDDEIEEQSDPVRAAADVVNNDRRETAAVRLVLRDATGRVLADSGTPGRADERAEILHAHALAARGVIVEASASDAPARATLATLGRALGVVAVPILLLSFLFGAWIARRMLRPLSAIAERAAQASSLARPVRSLGPRSGLSEIDRMGSAFDRLLERLDDALRGERRLTADASHELRTPLTVLAGELELARARTPAGTELAADLERARAHVATMSDLVESLLLVHESGEGGAGRPEQALEPVNLCDQTREALAIVMSRDRGRAADITLDAPDEILVPGRAALVGSAILNLIDNAMKFTSAGQPIRITVRTETPASILIVEDGGSGVPEADRGRIFEPFFRNAEARAGTPGFGLGLPIVARVARAHAGDVGVSASALGGARFELRLPLWTANP